MDNNEKEQYEQEDKTSERSSESSKSRKAFSKLRRELSDDELNSPAVQKLLLDNLDELENWNFELETFQDRFHEADKAKAILEEKIKSIQSSEILYTFTLTIGAAIMGLAPTFWITGYGWLIIAVGFLLVIGGLISKFAKR
jgi:Ca2+-dependent lipid-binding protein